MRRKSALLLLLPGFIFYSMFVVYPYVSSVYYSFTDWMGVGPKRFIGFSNYVKLFTDPLLSEEFWRAFSHNATIFGASTIFAVMLGLALALLLATPRLKGRGFLRALYFLPYILPPVAYGFVWRYILNPRIGSLNGILRSLGLPTWAQPWLGSIELALPTVIGVWCMKQAGLYILFWEAGILSIPNTLRDAAQVDGCTRWQQIIHVELPLLKPTLITLVMLNFINSFGVFDLVFALVGIEGSPARATDIFATFFYRTAFGTTMQPFGWGLGMGAAVACVVALFLVTVSFVFVVIRQRSYVEY